MPAIETTNLTKRYGDVTAVRDLNLTVAEGEVFGFLGPNGAGKSTVIDVLLGFLRPTSGHATVLGHDATDEPRAVRVRVGLLPEGFSPYRNLTGRQHVASAIRTKGSDDDPDELLERVGLDPDDARRPASDYSKGMRQRMTLAIALVGEPDLLVFDEPSSGLDPKGVQRLRSIVREEADRGATVFFSSHVLGQVEKVCDRVGIMNDGELVAVDALDDLRERVGATVTVEATVAEIPDPRTVERIDGVEGVTTEGDTVRMACSPEVSKMEVLSQLDDLTAVEDFDTVDTSLEALFDAYTGGEAPDGSEMSTDGEIPDGGETPAGGESPTGGETTTVDATADSSGGEYR